MKHRRAPQGEVPLMGHTEMQRCRGEEGNAAERGGVHNFIVYTCVSMHAVHRCVARGPCRERRRPRRRGSRTLGRLSRPFGRFPLSVLPSIPKENVFCMKCVFQSLGRLGCPVRSAGSRFPFRRLTVFPLRLFASASRLPLCRRSRCVVSKVVFSVLEATLSRGPGFAEAFLRGHAGLREKPLGVSAKSVPS